MKPDMQPHKIKQLLNSSLPHIEQPTLDRLHDIREQVLARYAARAAAPSLVAASGFVFGTQRKSNLWVITVLLAACLVSGITYWHRGTERNVSDEDIAILTDDIPIHMYVE